MSDDTSVFRRHDKNLIHPDYARGVYFSFAITAASAAAMFLRYETVKIVGLTVVTDMFWSVLNHMIACRDCIEYFTTDNKYSKQLSDRLVRSVNPYLNGLVWGMGSPWLAVSAVMGFFLACASRHLKMPFQINARQLVPYMAMMGVFTTCLAHIKARFAERDLKNEPVKKYDSVPPKYQFSWEACVVRRNTLFDGRLLGYSALMMIIIAGRAGTIKL